LGVTGKPEQLVLLRENSGQGGVGDGDFHHVVATVDCCLRAVGAAQGRTGGGSNEPDAAKVEPKDGLDLLTHVMLEKIDVRFGERNCAGSMRN
jgi:hypothetical protein